MPLFNLQCLNEHTRECYAHNVIERACRAYVCQCGHTMGPVFSPGTTLTYFAEGGGGKWIHNLGDKPVFVTSHGHHEKLMREAGVTWAPARRGLPGCWGG